MSLHWQGLKSSCRWLLISLLPLVTDFTPANDRNAIELAMMSDIVIDYEKEHYPIGKPTVAQLIQISLDEKNYWEVRQFLALSERSSKFYIKFLQKYETNMNKTIFSM